MKHPINNKLDFPNKEYNSSGNNIIKEERTAKLKEIIIVVMKMKLIFHLLILINDEYHLYDYLMF